MTGWLDCPTCQGILADETCRICGATPETPEYTVTAPGVSHFVGPMCPGCMKRYKEAAGDMWAP